MGIWEVGLCLFALGNRVKDPRHLLGPCGVLDHNSAALEGIVYCFDNLVERRGGTTLLLEAD